MAGGSSGVARSLYPDSSPGLAERRVRDVVGREHHVTASASERDPQTRRFGSCGLAQSDAQSVAQAEDVSAEELGAR
jgi:hypothetical protein